MITHHIIQPTKYNLTLHPALLYSTLLYILVMQNPSSLFRGLVLARLCYMKKGGPEPVNPPRPGGGKGAPLGILGRPPGSRGFDPPGGISSSGSGSPLQIVRVVRLDGMVRGNHVGVVAWSNRSYGVEACTRRDGSPILTTPYTHLENQRDATVEECWAGASRPQRRRSSLSGRSDGLAP